jgi:hypothetical protein
MNIKLITALFITVSASLFSQEIKFADLATAQRGEFTSYVGSDGAVYNIGDRVKIGVPSSNKIVESVANVRGNPEKYVVVTALRSLKRTTSVARAGAVRHVMFVAVTRFATPRPPSVRILPKPISGLLPPSRLSIML